MVPELQGWHTNASSKAALFTFAYASVAGQIAQEQACTGQTPFQLDECACHTTQADEL